MFERRCFFTYSIETWIRLRTSVIADAKWRHSLRTISAFDDAEDDDSGSGVGDDDNVAF